MATVPQDEHRGWSSHFTAKTRNQLMDDDSEAFTSVAMIITAIVVGGLVLGGVGVLLSVSL